MLILFLIAIIAPPNYYLYRKAARFLAARWPRLRRVLPLWFLAINSPILIIGAIQLWGPSLNEAPAGLLKYLVYPFYAWIAMLVAFLPFGLIYDLTKGIWWLIDRPSAPDLARRGFLTSAIAAVPPLLYGVGLKGVYGPHDLDIAPLETVKIPGLPSSLDGMTITQVSDLHTGAYIRARELDRVVDTVNGLRGDMIVVTGDFMDNSLDLLNVAQTSLARLRAGLGVYGILGNHDYYSDRTGPGYRGCMKIMAAMQAAGIHMLRDSHLAIQGIVLGGVDWTGLRRGNPNSYDSPLSRAALTRTFAGAPEGQPRILLAHHPHVFIDSPDFGVALTLAGHTHGGGQVVIAERHGQPIAVGTPFYRYISGLYTKGAATGASTLYVNRGIGYVGIPIRLNCPPEISRFKLVRA